MPATLALSVPKRGAGEWLRLVGGLGLQDSNLKLRRTETSVLLPLTRPPTAEETRKLKSLGAFEVLVADFDTKRRGPRSLVEALEQEIPQSLLESVPRSVDFIGEVAVIEVPVELEGYKRKLGDAVLSMNKRIRTVLAKSGRVGGIYRTRELEVIAGDGVTETVHKEYGCMFKLDVRRAYFSPRLGFEHRRVAESVGETETVVDMFAGVGPFAILIAKTHEKAKVYAIDLNPEAVEYLKWNVKANKVEDRVTVLHGDAVEVVDRELSGIADRVIMNLPSSSEDFVRAACKALRSDGGVINFYTFSRTPEPVNSAQRRFTKRVEDAGRKVEEFTAARLVRATAPHEWQVALDARVI